MFLTFIVFLLFLLLCWKLSFRYVTRGTFVHVNERKVCALVHKRPPGATWLSDSQFDVFVDLLNVFVPSLDVPMKDDKIDPQFLDRVFLHMGIREDIARQIPKRLSPFIFQSSASDIPLAEAACLSIERNIRQDEKTKLKTLLTLLQNPMSCFIFTGCFSSFCNLSTQEKQRTIIAWQKSSIQVFRQTYQTFRRLSGSLYFGLSNYESLKSNPTWKHLPYTPRAPLIVNPPLRPSYPAKSPIPGNGSQPFSRHDMKDCLIDASQIKEGDVIRCDVVIIGSGPGGSVTAHELCRSGFHVILVDKGCLYDGDDYAGWMEMEAIRKTYEQEGLATTEDGNIIVLSGSCLGGGSAINWCASFKTPSSVMLDWAVKNGLSYFHPSNKSKDNYNDIMDYICGKLNVNTDFSYHNDDDDDNSFVVNGNNRTLVKASEKSNIDWFKIPRNVRNCVDCSYCCHGCSSGSKMSAPVAFLMEACSTGNLQILTGCTANRIMMHDVSAVGAELTIKSSNIHFSIQARRVVSSCGAVNTPALLLRSGLKNPHIGRNLCLHPVIAVGGVLLKEKTNCWKGVGMGVYVSEASNIDGTNHGIVVENPPVHPFMVGLVMPFANQLAYRTSIYHFFENMAIFVGISRDRCVHDNRVLIDSHGNAVIRYHISSEDETMLLKGQEFMCKLMKKAGANLIAPFHDNVPWYSCHDDDDDDFSNYLSKFKRLVPNQCQIFSAHQMSSCRLSTDSSRGCVDECGKVFEVNNLYVADGSLLPTAIGYNPMISIYSVSLMVSRHIVKSLGKTPMSLTQNEDMEDLGKLEAKN